MVGTRRRSAVAALVQDVESPMQVEKDTPSSSRRTRRVSEVSAEQSTLATRVRSPRTSAKATAAAKTKASSPELKPSARKKSPENKHLAAALSEEVTKLPATRSPRTSRTASPRTSAVTASPRTSTSSRTASPRTSRSSRNANTESVSREPSTESTETSNDHIKTNSVDVTTELLTIANTRSKRLSGSSRPSTPTKSKLLTSGDAQCLTPSRKSRRLSGCGPEEVAESVALVLPPKKRRTSLLIEDDRNEEKDEKKVAVATENIPDIVVAPPAASTDNNLEMIQEIDEEAVNTSIDKTENHEEENVKESNLFEKMDEECTIDKEQSKISKENSEEEKVNENVENCIDKIETNDEKSTETMIPVDQEVETKESFTEVEDLEKGKDAETDKEKIKNESEEELLKKISLALINHIPRQKPKSGRFWKTERDQFRSIRKDRGNRKTFEERLKMKEEKEKNRDMTRQIKEEKAAKIEALKKRQEENKKRREKNELKSEVFQVIKNPNKIRRMKKRDLAKRDLLGKI